jgi:hypothetical protein
LSLFEVCLTLIWSLRVVPAAILFVSAVQVIAASGVLWVAYLLASLFELAPTRIKFVVPPRRWSRLASTSPHENTRELAYRQQQPARDADDGLRTNFLSIRLLRIGLETDN